jgi:hypothetical protein
MDCSGGKLQVHLETSNGLLRLDIADSSHVQIENGPSEFTCGEQEPPVPIRVQYAAQTRTEGTAGVVRGIEFIAPAASPAE